MLLSALVVSKSILMSSEALRCNDLDIHSTAGRYWQEQQCLEAQPVALAAFAALSASLCIRFAMIWGDVACDTCMR